MTIPEVPIHAAAYDEALAFCNARRREAGMPEWDRLPAGKGGSTRDCPCAQSAPGVAVFGSSWRRDRDFDISHDGPHAFVRAFDCATDDIPGGFALPVRVEEADAR